jgi:type IV fimbrial biogenesis protein FimT
MQLPTRTFDVPAAARGQAGFSLVELMVTVSLAAVLMAIGIPMFRDSIANNRLISQTNDMVGALTLARSRAITLNQRVTFCRADSEATTACSGSAGDWQFWLVRTATGSVDRRGALVVGSLDVTSALTNDQIEFASDGLARSGGVLVTGGGPHITVCSSHSTTDNRRQVTLGAGSRISTAKASGAC